MKMTLAQYEPYSGVHKSRTEFAWDLIQGCQSDGKLDTAQDQKRCLNVLSKGHSSYLTSYFIRLP